MIFEGEQILPGKITFVSSGGTTGVGDGDFKDNTYLGPSIFAGAQITRAGVYAEVGKDCAIGSIYLTKGGHGIYIKISQTPASTDWQKVTSTAAD